MYIANALPCACATYPEVGLCMSYAHGRPVQCTSQSLQLLQAAAVRDLCTCGRRRCAWAICLLQEHACAIVFGTGASVHPVTGEIEAEYTLKLARERRAD